MAEYPQLLKALNEISQSNEINKLLVQKMTTEIIDRTFKLISKKYNSEINNCAKIKADDFISLINLPSNNVPFNNQQVPANTPTESDSDSDEEPDTDNCDANPIDKYESLKGTSLYKLANTPIGEYNKKIIQVDRTTKDRNITYMDVDGYNDNDNYNFEDATERIKELEKEEMFREAERRRVV